MSHASVVKPPRIAVWIIELFASNEQIEPIQGDLLEDFSVVASRSGPAIARRWYWKQSLKAIAHLTWTGFRTAPLLIAVTTIGGFFLLQFAERLPERGVLAVLYRFPNYFETHFNGWLFWGIVIGIVIVAMLVGCLVAVINRGMEMIATMTLSLLNAVIAGLPYTVWFAVRVVRLWPSYASSLTVGQAFFLGLSFLVNGFAGSIMLVVGGEIVRRVRLSAARRASSA